MSKHISRSAIVLLLTVLPLHSINAQDLTTLLTTGDTGNPQETNGKVIGVDHSKKNDQKIGKRLQQIFSEIDDLKQIKVEVSNGVVTLSGEVGSKAIESKAVQFAGQIQDVVEVENNLQLTHSLEKRLQDTLKKLNSLGKELLAALPLFLVSILVFIAFWAFGGWLSKQQQLFRRISLNYFIADILGNIVHLVLIVLGLILALSLLDATALLGTILGAAGIFGLAIGFAVRDTVENFIASILLSIRIPFDVNDFVDIEGQLGNVARLTSRATILISPDGNHIRIPNATVFKAVIVNYSRNPDRRFEFDIGIGKNVNLIHAQSLALDTISALPGVLVDPKPLAVIDGVEDSKIVLRLYGWINQKNHDFLKVRSEAIKAVRQVFQESDIAVPDPAFELKLVREGRDEAKKENTIETIEQQRPEAIDISVDRTAEIQVSLDNTEDQENLLIDSAARE